MTYWNHRSARPSASCAFAAFTATLCLCAPSFAVDRVWTGADDGTSFSNPLNWLPNGVPGPIDRALFVNVGGAISLAGGVTVVDRLLASGAAPTVDLDLQGGLLQILNGATIGNNRGLIVGLAAGESAALSFADGTALAAAAAVGVDAGSLGEITIPDGGQLLVTGPMRVGESGEGLVNIAGQLLSGEAVVGEAAGSIGAVNVDTLAASWIVTSSLTLADAGDGTSLATDGSIVFVSGDLIVAAQPGSAGLLLVEGANTSWAVLGRTDLGGDGVLAGGTADVTIQIGASAQVGDELRIWPDGVLFVNDATLEALSLLVDGGSATLVSGATAVIGGGSTIDPGLFVGEGGAPGAATVQAGGTLDAENGFIARSSDDEGTLTVTGTGSSALFSGDVEVGSAAELLGRFGPAASLLLVDEATLDVSGTLRIRQRGTLRIDAATGTVGALDLEGDARVEVPLPQSGTALAANAASTLGGGLIIDVPGATPPIGTTLNVVEAPSLIGTPAVVGAPLLPVFRLLQVKVVDVPAGQALRLKVIRLPVLLRLDEPVDTDLDLPPTAVAVATFDDDEAPDAIVTFNGPDEKSPGTAQLLLNGVAAPGEPPGFEVDATVEVGVQPVAVAEGDLDGDKLLDAAVSNRGDGTISLLRNTTDVPFGRGGQGLENLGVIVTGGTLGGLAIADLDNDRDNDIVVADEDQDAGLIFVNDGKGNFTPATLLACGPDPQTVDPIDVDDDKDTDVVIVAFGMEVPGLPEDAPQVTVHENLGSGVFAAAISYEVGLGAIALATGDLNRDGFVDLVTANSTAGTVSVLAGIKGGAFLPAVDLSAGGLPTAIAIGDFDNDPSADLDIALLVLDDLKQTAFNLLRNDSANGQIVLTLVTDAQQFAGVPTALASGNADIDGPVDVVAVGEQSGGGDGKGDRNGGLAGLSGFISVLVATPETCPGDSDGDGEVNGVDLGAVLVAWGQTGDDIPEDFDNNQIVDGADLAILLSNWGGCL